MFVLFHVRQMISLMVVLYEDMLHVIYDFSSGRVIFLFHQWRVFRLLPILFLTSACCAAHLHTEVPFDHVGIAMSGGPSSANLKVCRQPQTCSLGAALSVV